ncbi:hypothetical protein [Micromonospora noduli]|uniref:hypothetical protein n=1 Tax=Micromonospora noduli TaxID=709876 RepID=UPI000DC01CBF|nr:hypothetical protein [Micromonospora noduli]RAO11068.1 hypothetical protein GUI43_03331 [Micromonospora noduli]
MIDLDEHNNQSAKSGIPAHDRSVLRQKVPLRLLAAFAVGVVLGGFGFSQLRDSRDQRDRNAVVALVAFPQSADSGSAASEGSVRLSGYLALANGGPGSITVRGVHAERPGVVISSIGTPRLLPPGSTGQLAVELWFECSVARLQREPLPLGLSVETDDEQGRKVSYPVALVGDDWERDALSKCSGIFAVG